MAACPGCGAGLEPSFRFCPWCAEPQRRKLVELFRSHPLVEGDAPRALRVSRYLGPSYEERHVRISVWNDDGVAEAALSIDEPEAERLAAFLVAGTRRRRSGRPGRRGALRRRFRDTLVTGSDPVTASSKVCAADEEATLRG
jgi:hypothetical protein